MTHRSAAFPSSLIRLGIIVLAILLAPSTGWAQGTAYLGEMPPVARVMADYADADPMTARAQQSAALFSLMDVMRTLAGTRGRSGPYPNAQERPTWEAYGKEANRLRNEGLATFAADPSIDSPRSRWNLSIERMQQSDAFVGQLLARYFSPQVQRQHQAALDEVAVLSGRGRRMIEQGARDLSGRREGTWERMTASEQQGALEFVVLMGLLLLAGLVRELRPFDVDGRGTPGVRFGFGRAKLHSFSGVVRNYTSVDHSTTTFWKRTRSDGSTENVTTTTIQRHEEFDLVHEAERHHVHTSHSTPALTKGGEFTQYIGTSITAVWVTRRLRKKGPYVLFRTLSSSVDIQARTATANIQKLISPRAWTFLPAMGLGFGIGSSTDVLSGVLDNTSPNLRGIVMTVVATAVWIAIFTIGGSIRQNRFDRVEMPKLRALVDAATRPS